MGDRMSGCRALPWGIGRKQIGTSLLVSPVPLTDWVHGSPKSGSAGATSARVARTQAAQPEQAPVSTPSCSSTVHPSPSATVLIARSSRGSANASTLPQSRQTRWRWWSPCVHVGSSHAIPARSPALQAGSLGAGTASQCSFRDTARLLASTVCATRPRYAMRRRLVLCNPRSRALDAQKAATCLS
jgi:hypothetical protein